MTSEMALVADAGGDVRCVYGEELDLREIGFVKSAIAKCKFAFGYGRSGHSLAAPTLRCVYPVGFTACLNDVRVHSFILEHRVVPMDRAT